jgi:glycosyltransferase involved in cell wall biosynthesis
MLDAAACGLPIVVNDTLLAKERIDGNGISYRLNDPADLAEKIRLLSEPTYGHQLGEVGARRMTQLFSWNSVARRRLADYEAALAARKRAA